MMHRIEALDLSFLYTPGVPVLRDVSASVRSGVVTGIIGPNGAGKSTLLQLLCGLLRPGGGQVTMDGKPLAAHSDRARARLVAYMPQSVSPAFSLSVADVVALGRFPHLGAFGVLGDGDHAIVQACLAQTETAYLAERDYLSLSGGERQRVLLASVLAQEPRILLLDEPTSALDLPHEVAFFRQLRALAAQDLGVVVITHDINMAAQFCDELLLLGKDHTLVCQGDVDTVLTEAGLAKAYGSSLSVGRHPETGTPFVTVPVGEKAG
jgi:iron complex transport system ATP-binding protein